MATKSIAAVAPVADLAVEALMPPAPPALALGGPVTAHHVAQAGALYAARKRHAGVTDDEMLDAKRAKTSWDAEAALARDPQPAPPGFMAAIMAAIAPLQAGIAQLQADSAANTAAMARLDAKGYNHRSFAINARRRATGGDQALLPIQMDRAPIALGQPGHVAGLPGQLLPAPAPAQLAVGATSAVFPAGFDVLNDLSHALLCRLAAEYCDDFGVLAADPIAVRRRKFLDFVCDA